MKNVTCNVTFIYILFDKTISRRYCHYSWSNFTKLSQSKVVCNTCDVCEPLDMQRLVNYFVDEPSLTDIWVCISSIMVYMI